MTRLMSKRMQVINIPGRGMPNVLLLPKGMMTNSELKKESAASSGMVPPA